MTRPRSLRFRLVAASVITAILGMVAVNLVAVLTLRSNLRQQVDQQLTAVPGGGMPMGAAPGVGPLDRPQLPPSTSSPDPQLTAPPRQWAIDPQFLDTRVVARLNPTTGAVLGVATGPGVAGNAAPNLSAISALIAGGTELPTGIVWVADTDGDTEAYRARVIVASGGSTRDVIVVARSMSDVEATIRAVTLVDAGVSVLAALLLVVLGTALVRVGLRPLTAVEDAAHQIAAGNLAVRAPRADEHSEVGSLARTFNGMVDTRQTAVTMFW